MISTDSKLSKIEISVPVLFAEKDKEYKL